VDNCPLVPNTDQADDDGDAVGNACDNCPTDPDKIEPGACGCGVLDSDDNGNGTPDCTEECTWQTARGFFVEMLQNGGFDAWSDNGPEKWSVAEQGGSVIEEQTAALVVNPPGSSLHMDRTATGAILISQDRKGFEPGSWYLIQWHGLAGGTLSADPTWLLQHVPTGATVESNGQTWSANLNYQAWTAPTIWGQFNTWVKIDSTFDKADKIGFVLRWPDGLPEEDLYLDQVSIMGPFSVPCVVSSPAAPM
jgi:hypothetical protein